MAYEHAPKFRGLCVRSHEDEAAAFLRFRGLGRVRNTDNFPRDILRRKNEIDTPAGDRALRHIRVLRRVEFLCNGNAANFFYAAERRGPVPVIAGNDDGDQLAAPVLRQGTQKNRNHIGPSPRLRYRL